MKNISEMTIKEIEDEIKMAKFDANENYVFVSYSHMDYKQVYPMVLRWIRKGYNIYLDVDFENHSGNENWVEMMTKALRSASCQLVACFYSENYCFSYPSMLELLTVCSDETAKKRKPFTNPVLPVDIICLENKPKDEGKNFSSQEIKNDYKKYFTNLRQKQIVGK